VGVGGREGEIVEGQEEGGRKKGEEGRDSGIGRRERKWKDERRER
jgi:hypothetical protein